MKIKLCEIPSMLGTSDTLRFHCQCYIKEFKHFVCYNACDNCHSKIKHTSFCPRCNKSVSGTHNAHVLNVKWLVFRIRIKFFFSNKYFADLCNRFDRYNYGGLLWRDQRVNCVLKIAYTLQLLWSKFCYLFKLNRYCSVGVV